MATAIEPEARREGESPPRRPPRSATVALTALLGTLSFVAITLLQSGGDPSVFVHAGDEVTDPSIATGLEVVDDSAGYDGQFFYRLAQRPWTDQITEYGISFDRPAYRQQRIGYPTLVYLASAGGREPLVPWALVGLNTLAVGAIALLGARLAVGLGRSEWWGLAFAAWPGLLVATARDLSEVVVAATLMGALLALRRRRWGWATAAMVLGVLTRETAILVPIALVGTFALGRLPTRGWRRTLAADGGADRVPRWVAVIPLGVFAGWQLLVRSQWSGDQAATLDEAGGFFAWPFTGLVGQLITWARAPDLIGIFQAIQLIVVIAVIVSLASRLRSGDAGRPHERLALIGAVAVLALLPEWGRAVVFLRWTTGAALLGLVLALSCRGEHRLLSRALGFLWLTTYLSWLQVP